MKQNAVLHGFNVGVIDPEKLTRIDLAKLRLAAEVQTNLMPVSSGKMFFRPGFEHIGVSETQTAGWLLPFVRSTDEAVALLFTNLTMRVLASGVPISRVSVSTAVTNGSFSSFTGWTDGSTGTATATVSSGSLVLSCPALGGKAIASQAVSVAGGDVNKEHALRVVVTRGPVRFRVGSTSGGDEYIEEITLRDGSHSLAFTPTGTFYIRFSSSSSNAKYVDSCTVESSGTVSLPTPWSSGDFEKIRFAQSVDVAFLACEGQRPYRIERRADGRSWSVVTYKTDDGPFKTATTQDIRLTPSVLTGNGTLTASAAYFKPEHVGCLFRLFHSGQYVTRTLAAEDQFCDAIRVTGVYGSGTLNDRNHTIDISGTWVGTISFERSFDAEDSGYHEQGTYTANTSASHSDTLSNSVIWYRLGFRPGNYTSGAATVSLTYDGGGDYGICRVVGYTSATQVSIEVLRPFKRTVSTADWRQGEWSDIDGWPSAVALFDGRLWWGRDDRFWGSVSDAFDSFDEATTGDAAPIARSIATGGINLVRSIMPLQRLLFLTNGAESSTRSSSLDEPLTDTNLTIRDASTVGSSDAAAIRVDSRAIFADRSGKQLWELLFEAQSYDYVSAPFSRMASSLFTGNIIQMAVQRRPDTRIWILLDDGNLICCLYEPKQEIFGAFIPIETDGFVASICIIPEDDQDRLYAYVRRTIGGVETWVFERLAYDSEAAPGTLCKCVDSHEVGVNSPASATITGLTHLEGEAVVVWADGDAVAGTYTVSSGAITLPSAVTNYVVGRPYTGSYKSARLAYGAQGGAPILQPQTVSHLGILMSAFHRDGVTYGPSFDRLDPLPRLRDGVEPDKVVAGVNDEISYPFEGTWRTDARVCLRARSPYPAHFLALVMTVSTNDRA